jgi:hypothetical protein
MNALQWIGLVKMLLALASGTHDHIFFFPCFNVFEMGPRLQQ